MWRELVPEGIEPTLPRKASSEKAAARTVNRHRYAGERILRCAGEPSLRNSAKCTRNFGIRVATVVKGLAPGA